MPKKEKSYNAPLLKVDNLTIQHAYTTLIKDISFTVEKGTTVAIVGESGAGKSLTGLSIPGLLAPSMQASGSITFQGQEILNAKDRFLRGFRGKKIGMIFQEPLSALNPLHSAGKQITEALTIHGYPLKEAWEKTYELLEKTGIEDPEHTAHALPHELSGGQRQRVTIAIAIANRPDLLIADEPTTAIDATLQLQILTLLKQLQNEMNMGMIFITHDLGVVRHISDKILVMHQGEIVERNDKAQLFRSPKHPYTKMLLGAEPGTKTAPKANIIKPPFLDICDLYVRYKRRKTLFSKRQEDFTAIDGISFRLHRGETLGVVGASGSGKSSLAAALLKLIPSSGEIHMQGENISVMTQKTFRPMRREIQMIFQDPFSSLSPRLTIGETLSEGLDIHGLFQDRPSRDAHITKTMQQVGLETEMQQRYPHEFSGGQRQRIAIARALAMTPQCLIMDEPTSALDVSIQHQIITLLLELQKKLRFACLFISHDMKVIRNISHRLLVMHQGKIVEQGVSDKVLKNPQHPYTQELIHAAFSGKKIA